MAFVDTRTLDFGTLITRSFENLSLIRVPVAVYLAVAALLAWTAPLIFPGARSLGLILYLAGQYWLYHTLIKARGLLETQRYHIFNFVGLAFILIIPIMLGLGALLLPGLFLVARWIAAPAFAVAQGRGPLLAAGDSWHAVRGHTGTIASAVVTMFLITAAAAVLADGITKMIGAADVSGEGKPLDAMVGHLFPVLLLGLSSATYELIGPEQSAIEEVFG